jgi:hypothetical protein
MMKNINIPDKSSELMSLLEQARHEDLVLQLSDGSQFILSAVKKTNEYEVEMAQERGDAHLQAVLDERARGNSTSL